MFIYYYIVTNRPQGLVAWSAIMHLFQETLINIVENYNPVEKFQLKVRQDTIGIS